MKCQLLFPEKNKKNINLSSAELAQCDKTLLMETFVHLLEEMIKKSLSTNCVYP